MKSTRRLGRLFALGILTTTLSQNCEPTDVRPLFPSSRTARAVLREQALSERAIAFFRPALAGRRIARLILPLANAALTPGRWALRRTPIGGWLYHSSGLADIMRLEGLENIPAKGATVFVPNRLNRYATEDILMTIAVFLMTGRWITFVVADCFPDPFMNRWMQRLAWWDLVLLAPAGSDSHAGTTTRAVDFLLRKRLLAFVPLRTAGLAIAGGHSGFAYAARLAAAPIIPVTVSGTLPKKDPPKAVFRWLKIKSREIRPVLSITFGPPIRPHGGEDERAEIHHLMEATEESIRSRANRPSALPVRRAA